MSVRLNGSTSGYTELDAPAVAGSNTLKLPTGNGTADQVIGGDGAGNMSWVDRGRMTLSTAQNSTSGTSIDFTGIPSWAKRITVMFNGVSTNGTSNTMIRLGTVSGIESTGYAGSSSQNGAGNAAYNFTTGIGIAQGAPGVALNGLAVIASLGANVWGISYNLGRSDTAEMILGGFSKTLSGTLDRIRITTVNGTDTFDAGTINILIEG